MEQSLILIKPDAMSRGLAGTIIARFQEMGYTLVALKMLWLDKAMAQEHYAVHRDKPFFNGLIEFITSSPIVAAVFEGEGVVEGLRKAMGPTDSTKAEKGTIRGDFGLNLEQNSVHGSDSAETAEKEVKLFFSKDEIFGY
jgi:nucleoside-diphosphate kinase